MAILTEEKVVDQWYTLMDGAAGKSDFIFDTTEKHLKTLEAPNVDWGYETVKPGLFKGWMGKKREFLVVKNKGLKDHQIYVGVRDYGTDLSVSWFLTTEPKYFKALVSSAVTGSIKALSFALDLFDQEELTAYVTATHHCLLKAVKELMEQSGQDFTKVNTKSKGFLEVW